MALCTIRVVMLIDTVTQGRPTGWRSKLSAK
jgi:hypothetical protein